jgi:hypothetical protein
MLFGNEAAEFLNTKKPALDVGQNEDVLTPDLVEGRVATIRFQKH